MKVIEGDCLEAMKTLPDASVDAVICDPPYPCIKREYGVWTEAQWWDLMMGVCREVRRTLKPTGSAVFILQPNSRKVGSMRGWLWRFMAWACDEWNMVQDAWWWNYTAPPTVHTHRDTGLMRPSVKACVWLGSVDCYRDQSAVLWEQSRHSAVQAHADRCLKYTPSGMSSRRGRSHSAAVDRGGATPFNVVLASNNQARHGHGAGTPDSLADWWTRYICPPGGTVLDPFAGSGTLGLAVLHEGQNRKAILIEQHSPYIQIIHKRVRDYLITPQQTRKGS